MGKYEPLGQFLKKQKRDRIAISFAEIERVLGRKLPNSSKTHRAWWSNNPTNNVMTKEWLNAGFETEDVDISGEHLIFRKTKSTPTGKPDDSKPSFYGCMKGLVTFAPDFDPSRPKFDDIDWEKYDSDELKEQA
jgi:hypothetical protein